MARRAPWLWLLLAGAACAEKGRPLVDELIADSQRRITLAESKALREGALSSADERRALDHVAAHPDYTSYHLLFALQKRSPEALQRVPAATRAAVLCSALRELTYLNDWGHLALGLKEGAPARAIVEAGAAAKPCLAALLDDARPAPFFGSADATLSGGYRRCDFAYRYLVLILGEQPAWDPSPDARDAAIAALKQRLKT